MFPGRFVVENIEPSSTFTCLDSTLGMPERIGLSSGQSGVAACASASQDQRARHTARPSNRSIREHDIDGTVNGRYTKDAARCKSISPNPEIADPSALSQYLSFSVPLLCLATSQRGWWAQHIAVSSNSSSTRALEQENARTIQFSQPFPEVCQEKWPSFLVEVKQADAKHI